MKTTFLVTVLVLVLGLAGSSPADLVGHWRLDEASDTTAYDSSGNGNDGTLVGDPQWVPGYIGGALEFDGVDDHVSLFSPIDALIGDTVTISAWIKADSVAAGYHPIVTQYDTNWNGYYFYLHNDRPAFYLNYENQARSDEPINTGEWYHIAGTYDSSDLKIYVNGILKHTNSLDSNSGVDHNAYIGRDDVHYSYFDGMIEDVRVYDRALSTAEIKELAACPKAHNPSPPDGALLTSFPGGILGYSLSWTPGDFVVSHDVYFGDNFDDVNDGTGGTFQGNQGALYFLVGYGYTPNDPCPTGFVSGTTYYWRIDEVNEVDDESPWKGRVWSFSVPDTKAYSQNPVDGSKFIDPNADLSWEAGLGVITQTVYFGDDYDTVSTATTGGTDVGIATTYDPGPFELEKVYYWRVDTVGVYGQITGEVLSFTTARAGGGLRGDYYHWSGDFPPSQPYQIFVLSRIDPQVNFSWTSPEPGVVNEDNFSVRWTGEVQVAFTETYTFYTATDDGARLWINDQQIIEQWIEQGTTEVSGTIDLVSGQRYPIVMEYYENGGDAVARLSWSSPSTAKQIIPQAALSPPIKASGPNPPNGATGVKMTPTLTWSPGDHAASHQVYFGTDADAVKNATMASTEYIGTRTLGDESYEPGKLAWDTTYYWRIDEINNLNPDSPWKGNLWSFTTGDFLVVDNFEDYDAEDQIWWHWVDGLGYVKPDTPPHPGNGSGSEVGDTDTDSFTEETIVHGGSQSMPFVFNNNDPFKLKYSEAKLTLSNTRDWTEEGVKALSLWFQGYPASVGSFTDNFDGTYTMTGSGADIEGSSDEFHFAYKMLTGAGTIIARINSVSDTHDWAKAGIMIRETLDPNSALAFACITPNNGVAAQSRDSTGGAFVNANQGGITAPHWVKLERSMSGDFSVTHSTDGSSWDVVTGANVQNIPMNSNVYVGLAVTSHDTALTCEATLSNVTITGTVTGQWASQDIGIQSNDAEPLYVAIANNTGQPAVVVHDDPNAAQIDEWTEWNIDLRDFTGINLADVNSIAVGLGNRNNPQAGGAGKMYFDDFALYRPRCVPDELTLSEADFNSDCVVDFRDLEIMVGDWLADVPGLAADLNVDDTVDFKDYAVLADDWLDEQIWPDM